MNSIMIIGTFQLSKYERRIIHQVVHLEKIFLKLNIHSNYYEVWNRVVVEYTIIGITFCSVLISLYNEGMSYIFWECLNAYFSLGISYVVVSNIRSPLLNIALDKIDSLLVKIMKHPSRNSNNGSKLVALILVTKAHALIFQSMEYIGEIVSKFTMFLFCFNALQILVLLMTSQVENISKTYWVTACYDCMIIFYIIFTVAATKKKVRDFE